jgi:RNA polymerase sigma factor, sigma-70 family
MTFENTILPHRDALHRMARRLTRDADGAQDLVQETLIRAYSRLHCLKSDAAARVWLRTMLRNLFLNRYAREQRLPENQAGPAASLEMLEATGAAPAARAETTPERAVIRRMEAEAIRRAIAGLPPAYREVATLAHLHEFSYEEIAERCQISMALVRTRVHRGRKQIQEALRAQGLLSEYDA